MNRANAAFTKHKILLVSDDSALRHSLLEQFEFNEEFEGYEATSGMEAIEKGKSEQFDLVLLDASLPDTDGRDIYCPLRHNGMKCPIITLADTDTIPGLRAGPGLDTGGGDCIAKPFRLGALVTFVRARLHQRVQRRTQSEDAVLNIGPYSFQPDNRLLINKESRQRIRLTEKETAVLKLLHGEDVKAVGRDILLREVWKYDTGVATHTLETHIYRLRQKIESCRSETRILVTENGGYRLAL